MKQHRYACPHNHKLGHTCIYPFLSLTCVFLFSEETLIYTLSWREENNTLWALSYLPTLTVVCVKETLMQAWKQDECEFSCWLGEKATGRPWPSGLPNTRHMHYWEKRAKCGLPTYTYLYPIRFHAVLYLVLESIRCFQGPECLPCSPQGLAAWAQGQLWRCCPLAMNRSSNELSPCSWELLLSSGSRFWPLPEQYCRYACVQSCASLTLTQSLTCRHDFGTF